MRRTMRSRLSIARGPLLDAFLVGHALDDSLHEYSWRVNAVWLELSGLDEMLHFGDGVLRRRRHHRVEVARGLSIRQVALAIALPRLDQREVGMQRSFEDVSAAVDDAAFLPFRDQRARAGWREEAADARAGGAHALRER